MGGVWALSAGMIHHPVTTAINAFVKELHELAKYKNEFFECDGAAPNDKLFALVSGTSPADCWEASMVCKNHAVQLYTVAVYKAAGIDFLAKLHNLMVFLGMGGHFLRLAVVTRACLRQGVLEALSSNGIRRRCCCEA